MADDTTATPATPGPPQRPNPRPSPSLRVPPSAARPDPTPAAAAASRARRIGGRISPADASASAPPAAAVAAPATEPAPARKPGRLSLRKSGAAGGAAADGAGDAPPTDRPAAAGVVARPAKSPPEVPRWLLWTPAAVLTAGVITMAVLLTVFSHGVWWGRPSSSAVREQMLAAAKTCVARTNTYKYTALDKYTVAAHECTTGRLTGQLDKTIATIVKKYAPTLKATQTAQISRGALEAVSPHGKQWTVLIFGQLTVVNTNDPKGRTDPFAAEVQMEKVHGKWLMSGLQTVSNPVS